MEYRLQQENDKVSSERQRINDLAKQLEENEKQRQEGWN